MSIQLCQASASIGLQELIPPENRRKLALMFGPSPGYAVLTALEHLVRPSDIVHVLALQSEHRDGTSPSPEHGSHCITDDDLAEYRKVRPARAFDHIVIAALATVNRRHNLVGFGRVGRDRNSASTDCSQRNDNR